MEVPRLGMESELHLLVYTTATAMQDPSCICELHHSSWHCWILNLLNEAKDQTCLLMDTCRVCKGKDEKLPLTSLFAFTL